MVIKMKRKATSIMNSIKSVFGYKPTEEEQVYADERDRRDQILLREMLARESSSEEEENSDDDMHTAP